MSWPLCCTFHRLPVHRAEQRISRSCQISVSWVQRPHRRDVEGDTNSVVSILLCRQRRCLDERLDPGLSEKVRYGAPDPSFATLSAASAPLVPANRSDGGLSSVDRRCKTTIDNADRLVLLRIAREVDRLNPPQDGSTKFDFFAERVPNFARQSATESSHVRDLATIPCPAGR